jgi:cytoskeletal protein RodZ
VNQLKEVRETSFLDLNEIADHLSIPVIYLRAIEEGKFSQLPKKKSEEYITAYADFLEVDPMTIIAQYHHSQRVSATSLPRRARKQESSSDWRSLLLTYRYPVIACVVCLLLALGLWLFVPNPKAAEKKSPDTENVSSNATVNNMISANKNRPVFQLQKEASDPEIEESWNITQVDSLQVQIQALGNINLRVRENGIKGNIVADKRLAMNESFSFEGKQWLVLHVDTPSKARIKINDVTIDTEGQVSSTTYEFKIASAD